MAQDQLLRSSLVGYANAAAVFQECKSVLANFKDLRPLRKHFIFNDGTSRELFCLEGTIPIQYKSNTYNIPVILWLMENHPYTAPMVYVQPTQTMNIKPGTHVDRSGKVTVAYLSDWRQNRSDLTALLQVLVSVFGESPPVFAKSSRSQQQQPVQPTHPPYPPSSQSGMPMPYPNSNAQSYTTGGYPPAQAGYPPATTASTTYSAAPNNNAPYNPYGQQPAYQPYGQGTGYPPVPSGSSGYPPSTTQYPSYPQYPQQSAQYTNPAATTNASSSTTTGMGTLTDEEIRRSLLSAVEDKMRRRLNEMNSTYKAEMSVLKNTQTDLNVGQAQLEEMDKTITRESGECDVAIAQLNEKIAETKEAVDKQGKHKDFPPEDAIDTTAPLYKQLLNSFAEEQAIEDAIYTLGEALRREAIEIEIYLKKVRSLSRKQFLLKALIQKCREKAGLSGIYP